MRGPLRPSPWIQHQFLPSYTRKLSHFTLPSFFFLFFSFFFFGQNCLECDSMCNYRRLTKNCYLAHIPENVIPGDFSQKKKKNKKNKKKRKKKKKKNEKLPSTKILWSAKILQSAWILSYVHVLAVECDVPCGVRRICGMRRIPSMRGWYRDHIGKFRGRNQNSNPKAGPNFQGHTSGFYFSKFTLGEVPGKKLANFYLANL